MAILRSNHKHSIREWNSLLPICAYFSFIFKFQQIHDGVKNAQHLNIILNLVNNCLTVLIISLEFALLTQGSNIKCGDEEKFILPPGAVGETGAQQMI